MGRVAPFIMLVSLTLGSCGGSGTTVQWQEYDPALLQRAASQNQRVLLDFWAEWCAPCKEMEALTFSDPRVIRAMEPFVRVRADLTDYEAPASLELRQQWGLTGVPELLFLNAGGEEIAGTRVIGFLPAEDLVRRIRNLGPASP